MKLTTITYTRLTQYASDSLEQSILTQTTQVAYNKEGNPVSDLLGFM